MGFFSKRPVIATHNGKYHADDVFACAVLQIVLGGRGTIVRTRDEQVIAAAEYAVDVGMVNDPASHRFDHHMPEGGGVRTSGIPYASFGLVWKEYGAAISAMGAPGISDSVAAEIAARIDHTLASPIDADDNGMPIVQPTGETYPYTLQSFLYMHRPTWKERDDTYDSAFLKLVDLAKEIILREVVIARDTLDARSIVEAAYAAAEDKRVVAIDMNCPWQETLVAHPEPLIVVTPRRGTKGWGVNVVPAGERTYENRILLPESWAGLRDAELASVTGVADALFCHRARFLAVAKTKEGALALAKIAISKEQVK